MTTTLDGDAGRAREAHAICFYSPRHHLGGGESAQADMIVCFDLIPDLSQYFKEKQLKLH